ncbi:unnamed protein product, partial [Prorocentrum cordatum]
DRDGGRPPQWRGRHDACWCLLPSAPWRAPWAGRRVLLAGERRCAPAQRLADRGQRPVLQRPRVDRGDARLGLLRQPGRR